VNNLLIAKEGGTGKAGQWKGRMRESRTRPFNVFEEWSWFNLC